jgi:hypothetical protein
MLSIFSPEKIPWLWPEANLRSWVPEVSMPTTRPPKLLCHLDSADISWALHIHQNDSVAIHDAVQLWVSNLREIASAAIRKCPGRDCSLWTSENIEQLCQDIVRSPQQMTSRNAIALRMSDITVCWILHEDFHPYKMGMFQAINDPDY